VPLGQIMCEGLGYLMVAVAVVVHSPSQKMDLWEQCVIVLGRQVGPETIECVSKEL